MHLQRCTKILGSGLQRKYMQLFIGCFQFKWCMAARSNTEEAHSGIDCIEVKWL